MGDNEPFELLKSLGKGGFAHTYLVKVIDEDFIDDFGAEEVALKIPLGRKKERVLRKELELNASLYLRMKNMDFTNIVRYLGFASFRGQIVMAMEYISQGSLRDKMGSIDHPKRIPVEETINIVKGVCNGLAVMHQEHVFHRDIKPENILMAGDVPKIADLGISRMLDPNEVASTAVGTLPYMSPEMLDSEGASFTSDLWSLGVMFYEMLTATLPIGTYRTPCGKMVDLIRAGQYIPACEICNDLPPELNIIIGRALSKDPIVRYQSATEMCEALSNFQLGKSESGLDESGLDKELSSIRKLMSGCAHADLLLAETKLKEFIAKHPDNSKVYKCLGELYNLCLRYEEAVSIFKKGLKIDPDNSLLHWDLALVYMKISKRSKAARHLEKVKKSAPDAGLRRHATTLLSTPLSVSQSKRNKTDLDKELDDIRAMMTGCSDQANLLHTETRFKDIITRHPDNSKAYQYLGELYNLCLRYTEAISSFDKGLEIDPENALLHWNLALSYMKIRKRSKAAGHLEKVKELAPDASLRRHAETILKTL